MESNTNSDPEIWDMDDEISRVKAKKMKRKKSIPALSLRMAGSLVTMMVLLWSIRCGFRLAMEPSRYTAYAARSFHIGVTTMSFGFLFLIVGLSILADLFLNISEQLQEPPGAPQAKETRTMSKAIVRAFVTVTATLMLLPAIYTGFRITTESRGDIKHLLLTVSIGVTTITFGFIYFIIGLAIVLELALDLLSHFQKKKKEPTSPQM
ncbi:hypothetical protein SLEP1_g31071 [Rubroshorea leprosula]|uniref:Uncharacterized protein n=1 Tax=Rubroshorea leprosula TaxID=152421 RepID=A0AAV5K7C9_9ROSI|nr:hypothetical protein SLEP1_g31071 [Rubroshorea leprosula]